jgi:hypothetical protein
MMQSLRLPSSILLRILIGAAEKCHWVIGWVSSVLDNFGDFCYASLLTSIWQSVTKQISGNGWSLPTNETFLQLFQG